MDVIKTRMTISKDYKTALDCAYRIYTEEGFSTFFSGAIPRLMHKIPANGLFFFSYEFLKTFFGVKSIDPK